MKRITILPSYKINTCIQLPSSKSLCNRALILNALAKGENLPENLSDCDDTRVMVQALQQLPPVIDIMAAGTAMRFLTAFLSVTHGVHLITGTERMKQRPIGVLVEALRQLGADITYTEKEGFPPLRISGKSLHVSSIHLPGNVSSQYISALLMIAPVLDNGLHLTLEGEVVSRPYIDMTLQLMRQLGAEARWVSAQELQVAPQPYRSIPYSVESDWSAASYWYEICALVPGSRIELPGLFQDSLQGDAAVAEIFRSLGVDTTFREGKAILTHHGKRTDRLDYDFVNQPDLAQTLVVTCALLRIPFRFTGLQSLKIKETDRIHALLTEMRKLGIALSEQDGSIICWNGEECTPDRESGIDTYEDHRMALAFAPASLIHPSLHINNPQVVSKSYPHYWTDLQKAGFQLIEQE